MNRGQCASCHRPIAWLETAKGKRMPVDLETVTAGETKFDHTRHRSHFATCPQANQHRAHRERA